MNKTLTPLKKELWDESRFSSMRIVSYSNGEHATNIHRHLYFPIIHSIVGLLRNPIKSSIFTDLRNENKENQ